jgi:hypothetical protein
MSEKVGRGLFEGSVLDFALNSLKENEQNFSTISLH